MHSKANFRPKNRLKSYNCINIIWSDPNSPLQCHGFGVTWKTTGLSASGQQTRASGSWRHGNRPSKRSVVMNGSIALNANAHRPSGHSPSATIQVRPISNPEGHLPLPMMSTISIRTSVPIFSATFPPHYYTVSPTPCGPSPEAMTSSTPG